MGDGGMAMQNSPEAAPAHRGVAARIISFTVCFACFWASSLMVRQETADVPFFLHYTSRGVEIATCLLVAAVACCRGVDERVLRRFAYGAVGAYAVVELSRLLATPLANAVGPVLMNALGGVSNGAAVALLLLLIARNLSFLSVKAVAVVVPAALGCSHLVFLLTGILPKGAAPWFKLILLVVATVGLALWMRRQNVEALLGLSWAKARDGLSAYGTVLERLSLSLGVVVFPLLYGFMAQICTAAHVSSGLFDASTELVAVVFMILLAVGGFLGRNRLDTEAAFAVLLSVFATAFLFMPIFWGNEVFVAGFIMKCGFVVYSAILWVSLRRMVGEVPQRCFLLYGVALGVFHAALMAGRLTAHVLTSNQLVSYQTMSFIALAVVWLLSMTALAVILANRRSRTAAEAERPCSYDEAFDAFAAGCGLSEREGAVCREYARGRTVEHIAATLEVSQETVKTHLKRSYAKCGCHSRQELIDQIDCCRDRETAQSLADGQVAGAPLSRTC